VIDNELQKLSLYRHGQMVRQQDVEEMVSYAREASIFTAVDAVLEGRAGAAIRLVHQILESGQPATYVITMIARQARFLILAKDLKSQRVGAEEIGRRLSISGYPLRKTLEQESRFTMRRLTAIHHKLLEADLGLKSTGADDQTILDMLIADLATAGRA
jgi:DNA polymerase-3 subunit delta